MKIYKISILLTFTMLFSMHVIAQNSEKKIINSGDLDILIGDWKGTLIYLDYSSNKPYSMPANLIVKRGKNGNELLFSNIYPKEPKANNDQKITVSKEGRYLDKKEIKRMIKMPDNTIEITTEYAGKDNRKKALIRNVYLISETRFVIRKEVQFEDSADWIKRNEFSYTR